ncbi:FxsB family cyclophane-forming radical SAM/SPASM peptide maturase [Thermostaphylospora chromogena]|uniref:Radical SAM core domain-containing protein n=1 Tax=Thermostaphylospora chromogena TaxID=35622 RepID=A0A1H1HRE6_9ACTN|nr:FxsB family cyclophane-forming radical SAM/SPASM peptide maturase [Thermostaphylospora chromogena]SDR27992.1 uncharacterized protein SAMN04489764_4734 [Thermostaphylospora chromogena]
MDGPLVPFRQFVLKVHSRCDLACDHCYVYEHADQSWRTRPKAMPHEIVVRTARRIADHVQAHALSRVTIVLHGGEPLLAGPERLGRTAAELRAALDPLCELDLRLHTNGVLLDDRFMDVFAEHRVKVGVSLDGDRAANDRHRLFADGRSSFDRVIRAIERLRRRRDLFAGLLCTIDVRNDPAAVYRTLAELDPPQIDFLLPHATWDTPPLRPTPTAYADWLIEVFELWLADGCRPPVRMFRSIIDGPSGTESLGLQPADLVVVETDGAYEQADSLKTAYPGAPATGLDVMRHDLDTVARHTGIVARQRGLDGLCETCRACPVVKTCGGGLYAHRFRSGTGFANPSVYSPDLLKLITYIRERVDMRTHTIPLHDLARGFGDADDIARLAEAQESISRGLIGRAADLGGSAEAWDLLVTLDQRHRDAVRRVLTHPYIRAWAVNAVDAHPRYLGNIAVAAAAHAGVEAEAPVEVIDGAVHLPTLGTLRVGPDIDRLRVRGGEPVTEGEWRPLRRLTAGDFSVVLEDADPFRDCYGLPPAPSLPDDEVARWQRAFDDAWKLIESDFSRYAPALRAGLSVVMPLEPAASGKDISAAARHAFGAVAIALPADPAVLALLLLHEFQHVKMGAVLDILDLYDESDERLFYAPWRNDLRPLEGLLQGAYAHIAVTDFWRVRRYVDPERGDVQFARWRSDTAAAVETLAESGSMTQIGKIFVAGMRETITPWLAEPVPPEAVAIAARQAREHRAAVERGNGTRP